MHNDSNPSSNESVSSTLTASSSGRKSCGPNRHRQVRFASALTHLIAPTSSLNDMSTEEREQLYWLPAEYNSIKTSARLATHLIMKSSKDNIDLIDAVYSTVSCLSSILDDEGFEAALIDPSKLSHHLKPWPEAGTGRGLEKYVSSTHRLDRSEISEDSRCAVLNLSQNPAMDADDIAHVYQKMVRSAALYARVVGEADALSANERLTTFLESPSRQENEDRKKSQRSALARQCAQPYDLARYLKDESIEM